MLPTLTQVSRGVKDSRPSVGGTVVVVVAGGTCGTGRASIAEDDARRRAPPDRGHSN